VQLATYRRQLTDSSQEVKNLATSVSNLRAQIAKLEGTGDDSSLLSVGSVPSIGQEYVRLMRDFKIKESLMELLTKQYEMAELSEAKDVSTIQVIQSAKVPERKSSPARTRIVFFSTFFVFCTSVLAAFFLEYFKRLPLEEVTAWKNILTFTPFRRK